MMWALGGIVYFFISLVLLGVLWSDIRVEKMVLRLLISLIIFFFWPIILTFLIGCLIKDELLGP